MTRLRRLPRSEAEPCLFCGKQPMLEYVHGNPMVRCIHGMNLNGPVFYGSNLKLLLDRWNTRRAPAEGGAR